MKDKAKPHVQSLATQMIRRMCIGAMSANELFRGHEAKRLPILDSTSIAILSRALIEAGIMYWYLMEDVSEEEWTFRLQVIKIHDSAARVRFLKGLLLEDEQTRNAQRLRTFGLISE
ncbi:hypothetical protein [Bradyrhizobium sp. 6(2017)]|uniref:hypothetical protein n=1 Tax=Bradyrhizobium sp. 6(2017) TaxID=1197460 RepID=UPI0013E0F1D8|nr:hypothetical protein [Bradyrhizobium sp. 6(2017)]QIG91835.1 hypothetical protein G6P99_04460 [Bradyrhizobium sp. 6(2017)]